MTCLIWRKQRRRGQDLVGDGKVPVPEWHQERMGGLWPGLPHRQCVQCCKVIASSGTDLAALPLCGATGTQRQDRRPCHAWWEEGPLSIRHSQLSTHRRATPKRVLLKAAWSGRLAEVLGTGWLEWVGAVRLCLQKEGLDLSNSREGQ